MRLTQGFQIIDLKVDTMGPSVNDLAHLADHDLRQNRQIQNAKRDNILPQIATTPTRSTGLRGVASLDV